MRKTVAFEVAESDAISGQNQAIESRIKMFNFKITLMQVPESSIMQVQHHIYVCINYVCMYVYVFNVAQICLNYKKMNKLALQ